MAMLDQKAYKVREFSLSGLSGISDQQLEVHFGLYRGYVNNTNTLNEHLNQMLKEGKSGTPEYAEMTRRLGFEYNGMILHEYYFGNLKANAGRLDSNSRLGQAIAQSFGSMDNWMNDFRTVGMMRGVGWTVLYQDPSTGWLSNHWITLHQDGHPAGFKPLLVMDMWEHAFMVDYKPAERSKYLEAFLNNVDWSEVEQRLVQEKAVRPIAA